MHVVKLLRDFKDSSVNNHVLIVVNLGSVSTSSDRFIHGLNHSPLLGCKIVFPSILKFVIFIILTSKNVHAISVNLVDLDTCRMTSSWAWNTIWLADSWNLLPLVRFEFVSEDVISSLTKCETTENNHRVIMDNA